MKNEEFAAALRFLTFLPFLPFYFFTFLLFFVPLHWK